MTEGGIPMHQDHPRPPRREFLGQLGLMAIAASVTPAVARAESLAGESVAPTWDMSWVERVTAAPYKAVIDTTKPQNDELYTALDILDTFHEVYDGPNEPTRVVVVFRHFAAAMGLADAMWDKYSIGEARTVTDPATKAPARRNPFLRAGSDAKENWEINSKIEPLAARGAIFLVCNRATMGLASSLAKKANKPVDEVQAELRANLVPGAIMMPNGIFALIRAQNAGCAFYRSA
jgi:intracellular sulfur oxidation DsrE/DsrF family protein